MNLHNLTPHVVRILDDDNKTVFTFLASPTPLRVEELLVSVQVLKLQKQADVPGSDIEVNLLRTKYTKPNMNSLVIDPEGLYIVSRIVKNAIKEYNPYIDQFFIVPADIVRDEKGSVVGCKSFSL